MEMTTLPTLSSLGFSPFFEQQLDDSIDERRIARVAAEHRGACEVWSVTGVWPARIAGRFHRHNSHAPGVGDWVILRDAPASDHPAIVERLFERRTLFTRGAAGRDARTQVVAANVDLVFAVTGLDADYNVRRLERYLARVYASGADPAVILNKSDLCDDTRAATIEVESHCRNVPIVVTSALSGEGIAALRALIQEGMTVAFVGSSGTGKSSLINALLGDDLLTTATVRASDGRGRHTTTHRQLIVLPDGGVVLDTPGMRELQLLDDDGLTEVFDDIAELSEQCRFRDCRHAGEPGCAVLAAAGDDVLMAERLDHYHKLEREAEANELRHNVRLRRKADRIWGQLSDEVALLRKWKGGKP
ncbi:MAG TPA: ribosome small subunit-dependent GTPase A [Thermoanaerobaculia bacterium]